MHIKATGKLDVRTHNALQKAHLGAMNYIAIALIGVTVGMFIFELVLLGFEEGLKGWPLLALAGSLALLLFVVPRLSYKQLGRLKNAENEYVFGDEGLTAFVSKDGMQQQAVINYDMIDKVIETREFFFIYQTKITAFCVDKATIEGGTAEDIRAIFEPRLGKKYVVRKG